MKSFRFLGVFALVAAAFIVMQAQPVSARPQYKKQFDAAYKDSKIAAAAKEAKCNVCHYGKSKKNRNDYGKALSKLGLTKDSYNEIKSDKAALAKKVDGALKAVLKVKSSGGETFGALIEAGKLPGTAPEE